MESTASVMEDVPPAATYTGAQLQETPTETLVQDSTRSEREVESKPEPEVRSEALPIPHKAFVEPPKAVKEPRKSPTPFVAKPRQEAPSKLTTDFRGTLRSRAPPDTKKQDTPEFLSRFGNLRKTQAEKFVAPDVLKDSMCFYERRP